MAQQEESAKEMDQDIVHGFVHDCQHHCIITILSRQPHLEEEAMVVEQEEMMEEDDITHQPSQEERIPREPREGVQMYDRYP